MTISPFDPEITFVVVKVCRHLSYQVKVLYEKKVRREADKSNSKVYEELARDLELWQLIENMLAAANESTNFRKSKDLIQLEEMSNGDL